jgi:hypothetical protein
MRRALIVAIVVCLASPARAESFGDRLAAYYASPRGYRAVKADVLRWHKTTRNGCVAFASTALRHQGVEIGETQKLDGEGVSRITRVFVMYLEDDLGWTRITDSAQLEPGDLVFTTDVIPGYPAHVVVFAGWADRKHRIARVVDNSGRRRKRAMHPPEDSDTDPFAFALRAPPESPPSDGRRSAQ